MFSDWSIALYCAETCGVPKVNQKHMEGIEMWYWRMMETHSKYVIFIAFPRQQWLSEHSCYAVSTLPVLLWTNAVQPADQNNTITDRGTEWLTYWLPVYWMREGKGKDEAVPLQAWSGPEGSRKLRFPDFMTTAQDGGKVVSLTHRLPLPPGNTPGTHFC